MPRNVEPGRATGGGEVGASGPMFWIARAGGQKVTIRGAERERRTLVPAISNFFACQGIFPLRSARLARAGESGEVAGSEKGVSMRAFVISTGAAVLLAGCGGGEQQQIENGIRARLSQAGTVTRLSMTKQADGTYAGMATVRTADGQMAQVNCTARREGSTANTSCAQVIDQALIEQVKGQIRQQFTARGLTVSELEMARQDDNTMAGHAVVRDASGNDQRVACTAPRDPATNMFALRCEEAPGGSAAAAQPEGQEAPAPEEPAPADQ